MPTWNFITVQARGDLAFHEDEGWTRAHVAALTDVHEADLPAPWSVDDAPSDFIDAMVRAIVGVEVRITSLEGKWKLSQNRTEADVMGVMAGLASRGPADGSSLADLMAHALHQRRF